ncbi:hypothetical protein IMG5_107260 [Ichthyophthirius multifiliis]|uniref:Transmembrane protein n=1 Tax=Ichthyophthirius multifiliis TaxID=5932 RepID=G0QTD1_ICHMU|nr:hypothetical protein IMG5_107260 [Ichthyophthirius multifiliis]EGR31508.1 hypothetical protein IMG5_107260 [Ichthyophthirius multifiliis]|eukprot:XP_004034994.1 hypothetical protein IMG5_107260 [Ichthyophthirius multifiliis]
MSLKKVHKLLKLSFYFILATVYPECLQYEQQEEIVQYLSKKMSRTYAKLFSQLPQPKDEIINYIIFSLAYINHYLFFLYFPKQRDLFDLRFKFNCYHILIFELNGIFVSDFYIIQSINKIFNKNNFSKYDQLIQNQEQQIKQLKPQNFFGFELQYNDDNIKKLISDNSDAESFFSKIIKKEKVDQKQDQQIFEKTQLTSDSVIDSQAQKRLENNYFGNLQLNCNQISPCISNILQYENRQLPFEKRK